jgi:hypothetical protein
VGTVPSSPLLYTHQREEKKDDGREKEHTHTKPQPLSGVVKAGGCFEAKIISPHPMTEDGRTAGEAWTQGTP